MEMEMEMGEEITGLEYYVTTYLLVVVCWHSLTTRHVVVLCEEKRANQGARV